MIKKHGWCALLVLLLVVFDQLSKSVIFAFLKGKSDIVIVNKVFSLSYLENTGAAFSLLTGKQNMLILMTIMTLLVMIWKYLQIPSENKYRLLRSSFILIASGAIGNLLDRLGKRFVIDFFYFIPFNFPKFNIADVYVVMGILVLIVTLFSFTESDFDGLMSIKGWK